VGKRRNRGDLLGSRRRKAVHARLVAAFSDGHTEINDLHAGEDFAVVEFVGRGTHDGTLQGPAGGITPTNQSVDVQFCKVYHIRDGKVASGRTFFDAATMRGQLRILPPPEQSVEPSH
jgi:ketosteroid isomerase-like protein